MKYALMTHVGNVRSNNEDSVYIPDGDIELAVVADGMGGHSAGEVASSAAIRSILDTLKNARTLNGAAIRRALFVANDDVLREAMLKSEYRGMGTTVTCALLRPKSYTIGHVGDSCAFRIHDGVITKLTQDHTYVRQLLELGVITEEEAKNHPHRNIITNCVGSTSAVRPEISEGEWELGDRILLCSDGLSDYVDEAMMLSLYSPDGDAFANALVSRALELGGADNISVVIAENDGEARDGW